MVLLSASTLGAPGVSLDQVLLWLKAASFDGIELRFSAGDLAHPAMTRADRLALRHRIEDAGIRVTGIASYVSVCSPASDDIVVGALVAAMAFAADVGAPLVRVFPGAPTAQGPLDRIPWILEDRNDVDERGAQRLSAVAGLALETGVVPALETHDSHPTGRDIARILARVEGPVGAIWDLMHPWRVGEHIDQTYKELQPWLDRGNVQVKDANFPASMTPLPLGHGTLPTAEFAGLLQQHQYNGTVTLEWEKKWHPTADTLPTALSSATAWLTRHWTVPARGQ